MGSARAVGSEEFREAMAPMVADVRTLTLELDAVTQRQGGTAWADSRAMKELADEQGYRRRCSWSAPISDTHMLGGLTLNAATDYVRTFVESFATESVPTYGHLVLARSALESSVVTWWLSEADVARDDRVKRGLSEFLYSATEVYRLKLPGGDAEQVKGWTTRSSDLGWRATDYKEKPWKPRSRGTPRVDGVQRPSMADGIRRLLVSDAEAAIGKLLWSQLSAVSHVTFFGLQSGMLLGDAQSGPLPGVQAVPVGTDASSVMRMALCVVVALREAATARFMLMGWEDTWKDVREFAEQVEVKLFRSM
jgi:hypothetical protein